MSKARRLWLMWGLRLLSGQNSRWVAAHQGGQRTTRPPKTWVATLGHPACERPVHGGHRAAQVERHIAGLVVFSERTAGQRSFHVLPSGAPVQFRLAGFRILQIRRLWLQPCLPVWRPLDPSGHHREFVLWWGFWVGAGSRWSLRLLVARLGAGSPRTSGSRTWTSSRPTVWMNAVLRCWLMGCLHSTAPNFLWTPLGVCVGPKWRASPSVCRR